MTKNKTILLVEDDFLIASVESKQIEKLGYSVIIANSGEDAITKFNNNKQISLILMDIDLGKGIDGTETAERILILKEIPIVFLSSHTDPEIVARTEKITSYGYVVKNSGITVLDASIKMAFKLFEAKNRAEINEERLQFVLEGSKLGFWDWNIETNEVQRNERWAEMLGYTLEEIQFTVNQWTDLIHPEDRERAVASIENHLSGKTQNHQIEYRMKTKNGDWKWIFDSAKVVKKDKYGRPLRMSGTHTDITERKLTEEKIKSLLTEKEIILKEVNHRIKNNMLAIQSIIEFQISTLNDSKTISILKDIQSNIICMSLLYDKLYKSQNFIETSAKDYLTTLVDEILNTFPIRVQIQVIKEIDEFILDGKKLFNLGIIINEVITNSMKYAFIHQDKGTIQIVIKKDFNKLKIHIQDDGIGIPENLKLNNSNQFGLSLISLLTKQLKGTFSITNNQGTRVEIELNI
ncbi:MAG: PAS domain-containing protein [Leptospiraceae bacterium]|nr:PAS domain-containing protein [Leptospiraceae bacterium]MCP5500703.1 PAS domain-containing protein [Leptospiraceae bacterium]